MILGRNDNPYLNSLIIFIRAVLVCVFTILLLHRRLVLLLAVCCHAVQFSLIFRMIDK